MDIKREDAGLLDLLKQQIKEEGTIFLTGIGSSAAVEATIKQLGKGQARRSASNRQ